LGKRVLLVEDQVLIRLLLAESLVDDGFDVFEADDGNQAILQIDGPGLFELLITDIQMPGEADGNAVGQRTKTRLATTPVIYMTGNPSSITQPIGPHDAILKKPFGPAELMTVVQRSLPSSRD
jgi:CheY-like chemotaxis protein